MKEITAGYAPPRAKAPGIPLPLLPKRVLSDMMDAAMKGYCEELIRIKSYMIESQSSGKAASWTAKDLGNVVDNVVAACSFVKDMTSAMNTVATGAKDIQVDGDQIAINGYKTNEVSSDTT